jgi:hypothetical protein
MEVYAVSDGCGKEKRRGWGLYKNRAAVNGG